MPEDKKKDDEKTFTQEQVNSMLADQKRKIQGEYSDYDEIKAKAAKLDEAEAKNKTESQQLLDRIAAAEKKAEDADKRVAAAEADALRLSVAADKGLTPGQAKRLSGSTREELEADADDLLKSFTPVGDDGKSDEGKPAGGGGGPASRPREDLRGGGNPTVEATETNPAKLAESVPRL